MSEYINRKEALHKISINALAPIAEVYKAVEAVPVADVQPVKWIPVTERLPQIEKDVLVCAYGTLIRTWCLHKKYSKRFWETEEGYFDDFNAVSHWMPLPEPPKDGET